MTTTTCTRPTCNSCGHVYVPAGPHWDGLNHSDDMARAAGWGVWDGTTRGGRPMRVVCCPDCRRGGDR